MSYTASGGGGAVRAPIVFDNGNDLWWQVLPTWPTTVQATLDQLEGNLRGSVFSSTVLVRLRGIQPEGDGLGRPVILGEVSKTLR